jgi:putative Mg2+ transporter-C (MgtC) family protein
LFNGDFSTFGTFALNTLSALGMGILIGLERQWRTHPAGLRTNALVAFGAALFVSLSTPLMMNDTNSPTRVASYVVSGLGFLGGGVIIREGMNVKGLSTAATIWCSGAVGTLCAGGYLPHAGLATAGILGAHLLLRPIARWIDRRTKKLQDVETHYRLRVVCPRESAPVIRAILLRHVNSHPAMTVQGFSTHETDIDDQVVVMVDIYAASRSERKLEELVARINVEPGISAVSWEKMEDTREG